MACFASSDDLQASSSSINNRHKKLIRLVNEMHVAMVQARGKDLLLLQGAFVVAKS